MSDTPATETDVNASSSTEDRDQDHLVTLAKLVETEGRNWAIRPEMLAGLTSLRAHAGALERAEALLVEDNKEALEAQRRSRGQLVARGDVAVIPLKGVLMPTASIIAMIFGLGSGLNRFRRAVKEAAGDDDIGAIVLDIDSPGGLVDQIPEAAAELRVAREAKPVVAVANTLAASGAYWLAAQADEVVITASGEVGSIGVYAEHRDISQALEIAGIKPTLISAGKYKVEGNPYEPLDEAAVAAIQEGVDYFYGLFVSDVAKGRDDTVTKVRGGYGEGRVLNPKRAVAEGMADRIDTLESTVSRLMGRTGSGGRNRAESATEAETEGYTTEQLERVFDASFGRDDDKEVVH